MLTYGHEICSDLTQAARREWLVTNGLGGYAMGTMAGLLGRSYHGLLIAAVSPPEAPGLPPAARTLLLAKLNETVSYDGQVSLLFADQYADRAAADDPWTTPKGYLHLQRFHLEGTTPVWTYAVADALLEKRVWMQPDANTTYIRYTLLRGNGPLACIWLRWQPAATTTATCSGTACSPSMSHQTQRACGLLPFIKQRPCTCAARNLRCRRRLAPGSRAITWL